MPVHKATGVKTHHICTLLADIPNFFASSMRSSVDGKAVRL